MNALILGAAILPMVLAAMVWLDTPLRRWAVAATPLAPLPALGLAALPGGIPPATLEWLLLGTRVGLDPTGQVFLLFTALLWTAAGVFALAYHRDDPNRHRFVGFFLLTMSGNLALIVAQDVVTFYVAFAVMTFAAYPLVIHAADAAALRAGRIYIVMAVIGETMLLAGLLLAALPAASLASGDVAAAAATSPYRDWIVVLLLGGFGIKAGAVPLHVWLPLAHPAAPVAASAVLSGAMIKAGLLGWLRFLPIGEVAMPGWGAAVIALGLTAAFFGVLIGATQDDAKTALAYSSISQMGVINVAVGIGLANPAGWPAALAACLVYVVHHGLGKGALFLGVGVAAATGGKAGMRAGPPWAWRLTVAGLAFTALAVAGAPLTSGMVAKNYLKEVAALSPGAWPGLLDLLLPLTAVGTTLLMGRFLILVVRTSRPAVSATRAGGEARAGGKPAWPAGLLVPWAALLAALLWVAWWVPGWYELELARPGVPYAGAVWLAIWPVIAGALLLWMAALAQRGLGLRPERFRVAAGDLLIPIEAGIRRARQAWARSAAREPGNPAAWLSSRWYAVHARDQGDTPLAPFGRAEGRLTGWVSAALAAIALIITLFGLMAVA